MNSLNDPESMAQITDLYVRLVGQLTDVKVDDLNDALSRYNPAWLIQTLNQAISQGKTWRWCTIELEQRLDKTRNHPEKFTQGKYASSVHSDGDDIMETWNKRRRLV